MAVGKEQVLSAAEALLAEHAGGMTGEALALQVSKQIGRALPPLQVTGLLRSAPQRFVENEGGRWSLRPRVSTLFADEPEVSPVAPQARAGRQRPRLRSGCYVVFDLEATGQDTRAPATEIIQIAAQRWLDGQAGELRAWFVTPLADVPERILQLTQITREDLSGAPSVQQALSEFFAFVGDLPLVARNGASYDGPLIQATCQRIGMELPATFEVLDTLPLARVLLPASEAHRVGTLAAYFNCVKPHAHHADADVEMLGGIVHGLQGLIQQEASGAAVYDLSRRAGERWSELLEPPARPVDAAEIIADFGARIAPLLPERSPNAEAASEESTLAAAFARAVELGRSQRPAQEEMARITADVLRAGGYAIIEAGTGTGKSQGYLLPAALHARAGGQSVAISTFTRVLQNQLVTHELPFLQKLVPELTCT